MRKRFTIKDELSSFTATMDARALEPAPIVHIELTDLDSDRRYILPNFFKFVAWFIVLAAMVSSCTVLIIYGEYFSRVKAYVWVAAFLTSFTVGTIVLEPVKVLFLATVKSCFMRKNVVVAKRKISPSLVRNTENPEKKKKILNLRQYKAKLYNPTPLSKLRNRLDDIKYHLEMKNVLIDTITYFIFFVCNFYILHAPLSNAAYYSNNAAVETFLNGRYTHSINYSSVKTYDDFLEYLNETFLPALLPNFLNDPEIFQNYRRGIRGSWDSTGRRTRPTPDKFREMQLLNYSSKILGKVNFSGEIFNDTGWTINCNMKLMGKARIRQIRVRNDYCKEYPPLKPRNGECAPELNIFNVETRNFTIGWKLESSPGLTENQMLPWKYQSAWETTTLPTVTKIDIYPGGGYIVELAKNIDDARIILEYLDTFQWVDIRTRAIFIEFTLYCVNTNFFDVVTLIFERSATGYFIPSFKVDTCTFILGMSVQLGFCSFLCCTVLFGITVRESVRVYRTSFKIYINRPFAVIDICLILTGIIRMILIGINHFYVDSKMQELEHSQNNIYISFAYASFWYTLHDCMGAVLMCLIFFQLLRFFSYKVAFYRMQKALGECYTRFVDLILQKMTLITAFALFFNIVLVNCFEFFSNFQESITILLCRMLVSHRHFDRKMSSSLYLTPVFLAMFILMVPIFFVNTFLAVACLYFHKVRQVPLYNRYHFLRYLTYCMTFWRYKDIVHFKERGVVDADQDDNPLATLRLRGGGNKTSRKCKVEEEYDWKREEFMRVTLKDFVTRKLYDTTEYLDLSAERVAALKYLMMYHSSDDGKIRSIFSEFSLGALFCALATEKNATQKNHPYFFVLKRFGKEVYDRRLFLDMKKVVEDFGKEAGIVENERMDTDEIDLDRTLAVLDEKLRLLVNKLDSKQKKSTLKSVS